ncbi:MAG: hypothetical protein WD894_18420 [Pirellulales bacterium]
MTPDGRVIVGAHGGGFIWTAETGMVELSALVPYAVSDDARVMVGPSTSNGLPVIRFDGTAVDLQPFLTGLGLDLAGWTLTEVTALSGDGTTIAGRGIPPDPSMSGAWIATIPEPSNWLLAATTFFFGAIGGLLRRRAVRSLACQS